MSNNKVNRVMTMLNRLEFTLEEKVELNKVLVTSLRADHRAKQTAAIQKFHIGQLVYFDDRRGRGRIIIRIEKINQKTVTGRKTDSKGTATEPPHRWKVSATMLRTMPWEKKESS